MMRTGSHVNAYFKGDHHKEEFVWFSGSNSMMGISISAEKAAKQILDACRYGEPEAILSAAAQLGTKVHGLLPGAVADVLGFVNIFLPRPKSAQFNQMRTTGWDSRTRLSSMLSRRSDRQIAVNNEA
jgi:hypothetical protein